MNIPEIIIIEDPEIQIIETESQEILELEDPEIATLVVGIQGPPGISAGISVITAGESISIGKLLRRGPNGVSLIASASSCPPGALMGISLAPASNLAQTQVLSSGRFPIPFVQRNATVFLAENGDMSIIPPSTGLNQIVGNLDELGYLHVLLGQPIKLR